MSLKTSLICLFVLNASYSWGETCTCRLDFQQTSGGIHSEVVSVTCPEGDRFDLSCDGDEFANTLTTKCSNRSTGQSTQNSSFPSPEGEPMSPWPSCSLF